METVVTTKGQIVIPAALRRKHGIKKGTRIRISERGGRIVLQPVNADYLRSLRGLLKGTGALKQLTDERAREREKEDAGWIPRVR